ncbi:MAG: MFS transporter [Planctomycetes bacterium]|nr:MFS transporter [Planctomycetota bacterium]
MPTPLPPTPSAPLARFLEKLALHRPELRAWALYDWANSAMFTVIVTAVFPIFYRQVAAVGLDDEAKRATFGWATTASLLFAALLSPLLGAVADCARLKKKLFGVFLAVGVGSTALMFCIGEGDWRLAAWLFGLANIGAAGGFVFYDALLSSVARSDEVDRLSTTAYAVGYLGGGLCLALCLAPILWPATFGFASGPDAGADAASLPTRVGFLVVAAWWVVFSIPFFRHVKEPALALETDERRGENPVRVAFTRLGETFRELRSYKDAFLFMLAFLIFNDGIGTIIRMAALFGDERNIDRETMIGAILLVQFVGIPFAVLFGKLAGWIGAKRSILVALVAYVGITLLAYRMDTVGEFLVMAVCVGMVQGGAQALSRSLFSTLVPKHKSGEFFGLFSTLEKFAGVLGPLVFSLATTSGAAILSLLAFFVVGGALLCFVDVEAGRKKAAEADAGLVSA